MDEAFSQNGRGAFPFRATRRLAPLLTLFFKLCPQGLISPFGQLPTQEMMRATTSGVRALRPPHRMYLCQRGGCCSSLTWCEIWPTAFMLQEPVCNSAELLDRAREVKQQGWTYPASGCFKASGRFVALGTMALFLKGTGIEPSILRLDMLNEASCS